MQGYRWRRRRASECLDFNRKIEQTTFPNPKTWYYLACFSSVMDPSVRDLLQCWRSMNDIHVWDSKGFGKRFEFSISTANARHKVNTFSTVMRTFTRIRTRLYPLTIRFCQRGQHRFWLAVRAKELRELTLLVHDASCSRITRNLFFSLLLAVESLVELHDTSSK